MTVPTPSAMLVRLTAVVLATSVAGCGLELPFMEGPEAPLGFTALNCPTVGTVGVPVLVELEYYVPSGGYKASSISATVDNLNKRVDFSGKLVSQVFLIPLAAPEQPGSIPAYSPFTPTSAGTYMVTAPFAPQASLAPGDISSGRVSADKTHLTAKIEIR